VSKEALYQQLFCDVGEVLSSERDPIVWMTTLSCLLHHHLGFFWVGFYRFIDGELVIGPYQGTLGCLRISLDRGVCGAAASKGETILVPDVHEFPGHIVCDHRSRSEIVVPVFDQKGRLAAVLDVDSDKANDFDEVDRENLEMLAGRMRALNWTGHN
jgi:L-methionine (R)-S-oxide reductase